MTEAAPQSRKSHSRTFCIEQDAEADAGRQAAERLAEEVDAEFGPREEKAFALAARDPEGGWLGGVSGVIHWRWLYVAHLFVEPSRRRRGLGRALLREAEKLARAKNCAGVYLDTFSPRALDFYRANGFTAVGRIDNFPPGAARTFLYKPILQSVSASEGLESEAPGRASGRRLDVSTTGGATPASASEHKGRSRRRDPG